MSGRAKPSEVQQSASRLWRRANNATDASAGSYKYFTCNIRDATFVFKLGSSYIVTGLGLLMGVVFKY